LIYNNIAIH